MLCGVSLMQSGTVILRFAEALQRQRFASISWLDTRVGMISPVSSSSKRIRQHRPQPSHRLSHSCTVICSSRLDSQKGFEAMIRRLSGVLAEGAGEKADDRTARI